ncbi:Purine nucleoside permease, partial [Metarhizium brunneum ARSEF 3297]
MMALVLSTQFDFRKSYFLFAGIAGVNPHYATVGSVAIARYAVQVALQYEIDPRSLPQDWPTGYISYGRDYPLQYPSVLYGTEVFEVNENLRQAAFLLASKSSLKDQKGPQEYRSKYSGGGYRDTMATQAPSVVKCDIATSDVYYSGTKLAVAFENTTTLWTNGSGVYCMSAQEENATLEVMVRAAIEGLVDFARIILVRAGSNFDRPPPGLSDWEHLRRTDQNGFMIAIENLFNVGIGIVRGIVSDWNCTYQRGIEPTNYIGDIFGSLGEEPDFGFGSITEGKKISAGGYNLGLANVEMERRKAFGLRAILK